MVNVETTGTFKIQELYSNSKYEQFVLLIKTFKTISLCNLSK